MKLPKIFIPQKFIQSKIVKRNAEKLSHVKIEKLANKNDEKFLLNNRMPLASFAHKNDIYLTFTNGEGLFDNQTIMKINKADYHIKGDAELPMMFKTLEYVGSLFPNLSTKEGNPREIIEYLKGYAKKVVNNK